MKRVLFILFISLTSVAFTQYNETVELKNGSILKGKIKEYNEEQVKLEQKDGSLLVFSRADVKAINQFKPQLDTKGYYGRGSAGLLGGPESASVSFQIVQGYAFSPRWQAGAGFGFEFIQNPYVPAFLEGQFNLMKTRSTPFVRAMAGYNVPLIFDDTKLETILIKRLVKPRQSCPIKVYEDRFC